MSARSEGALRLCPYTITWRWLFFKESLRLRARLGRQMLDIQHVGSTAIPGMVAKSVIDILVVVTDFEGAAPCVPLIEELGYEYQGESEHLRQYCFVKGHPPTYSLHVVERHSKELAAKLGFRDYLIHHPEMAQAYADLKRNLSQQFSRNRLAYHAGKGVFIRQILHRVGLNDCNR